MIIWILPVLTLDWVKTYPSLQPGDIRKFALGRYSLEKSIQDYRLALVDEVVLGAADEKVG